MQVHINKVIEFGSNDFLWKYLDLHKLFSFLLNKSLYFTRLDNFEDPLEGLTEKVLGEMAFNEGIPDDLNPTFTEEEKNSILTGKRNRDIFIKNEIEKSQKTQFANCWFVGEKESFAMWNIYSNNDSIAIRYNPQELLNIVIPSAESYRHNHFKDFIYGFVDYDNIWPFNFFEESKKKIKYSSFKKDLSYIHEREFRFVSVVSASQIDKYEKFELPLGDIVKDNFKIYANPYMESWKFNNLSKILEKFSIQDKLIKSDLKVKK